ncbi:MAG: DNA mismatch repair protein MutS [Eubacteriales bacterium]|nr:DNA mismatch repair protein MutS [Eubacteriales bacterium]
MLLFKDLESKDLSPMMQQYLDIKLQRPDCLLFFRLGDFYELFFDDAQVVAKELDLTLTGRDCGLGERAPMAGVPYHSADSYLYRLLKKGYKVAVCEQVEDPAAAKGLVKREVVRVLTPGTVSEDELLDAKKDRYLLAIIKRDHYYGLAALDLSSGRTEAFDILQNAAAERLQDEILRLAPGEILKSDKWQFDSGLEALIQRLEITLTTRESGAFQGSEKYQDLISEPRLGALWPAAAAAVLDYVEATQFKLPAHIQAFSEQQREEFMDLDANCRLNLELSETIWDRKHKGSLLWALDRSCTSMGARMLRRELERPLARLDAINERLDAVAEWVDLFIPRQNLRASLRQVIDLERLAAKLALERLKPRELLAIAELNELILEIQEICQPLSAKLNLEQARNLSGFSELSAEIKAALPDEPPLTIREGGLIRSGYNQELDQLLELASGGKDELLGLELKAQAESGIKKLKIGYNRVYGYYFEVPKSQSDLMPENYQRRQTLRNSERYISPELKVLEERITGAEEAAKALQYDLYLKLRQKVEAELLLFRNNAKALASLDFFSALAELAEREGYVRPSMVEEPILEIKAGRHPVVEQCLADQSFVPNSLNLTGEARVVLLTGPNMSGKSTYLRQNALICLMAHSGSFVPAKSAVIGLCDRIFTRIGAADNLSKGQSTFMVEMLELADILRQATARSLLILDEIGRGTSTFDGLSIAWAVLEHLGQEDGLKARSLFATHYHELCDLPAQYESIFNAHVRAEASRGELQLLHEIHPGPSNDSYGIDVARLAGVPEALVDRAAVILNRLEAVNKGKRLHLAKDDVISGQLGFFTEQKSKAEETAVIKRLKSLELDLLRPIEALQVLAELSALVQEREDGDRND